MSQNGPSREQVMSALWNLVSASNLFVTKERKIRLWGDVPLDQRPYLGMAERNEEHKGGLSGPPPVRTWQVFFFTYTNAKELVGVSEPPWPSTLLNANIQEIENALAGVDQNTGRQTLGGLVQHVWITGKLFKDPGDIDGDGVAIIPVSILVP